MLNEINALERAIDRKIAKAAGKRTRTTGTVSRIEKDGTVYVLVDGASEDTPVSSTTATVAQGDSVSVRVENGRAVIEGNATSPSVGVVRVVEVERKADDALSNSARAAVAAEAAESDAGRAANAADRAETSAGQAADAAATAQQQAGEAVTAAGQAKTAANEAKSQSQRAEDAATRAEQDASHANRYANAALDQLGVVQDVAGVLSWASEHGSFEHTSDTSVVEGKVYFTFDGTDYTPVVEPQAADLASYFELTVDEAMNDFIMAHLAVTQRGLWVLPSGIGQASDEQHAPGYKMLLSSNGSYLYDSNGVLVRSDTASGTDFSAGRDWHVGGDDAYIFYDASEGTIVIGGSSVQLGSTKTLSELVNEVDNSVVFKVTDDYSQDGSTVTLTAHVYQGGADVASRYPDSSFAWSRKNEDGSPEVPLGNGRTFTVYRSTVGYGAAIKCKFTPPNDSALLTESDDSLTSQEGEPLTARTPSGSYVRVADLSVETSVFDADRVMVVGNEDEHLVSIATLKDAFGGGDYERLTSKPSIESVTLSGNKTFPELGIFKTDAQGYDVADDYTLTTMDINRLWANAQPVG